MAREKTVREKAESAVMSYLNDNRLYNINHIYKFDKLGFLHIYWRQSGWQTRWLKILEPPESVLRELGSVLL